VSRWTRFRYVLVAGAAVSLAGVMLGQWWLTFVVGLAIGGVMSRARWAITAATVAGLFAWTLPLVIDQQQFGLGPTMTSLAAIMGVNGAALVPLFLTVIVGALLGLSGAWTGSALRNFSVRSEPKRPAPSNQPAKESEPALVAN
jgi:hypothetical protein